MACRYQHVTHIYYCLSCWEPFPTFNVCTKHMEVCCPQLLYTGNKGKRIKKKQCRRTIVEEETHQRTEMGAAPRKIAQTGVPNDAAILEHLASLGLSAKLPEEAGGGASGVAETAAATRPSSISQAVEEVDRYGENKQDANTEEGTVKEEDTGKTEAAEGVINEVQDEVQDTSKEEVATNTAKVANNMESTALYPPVPDRPVLFQCLSCGLYFEDFVSADNHMYQCCPTIRSSIYNVEERRGRCAVW